MKQEKKWKLTVVILILIITALHYLTASHRWVLHDFFRRLYYLPIILAAFQFRLKGGFIVSTIVILIYAPHLILYFGEVNLEVINQFLEIIMFMVVGLITGYLVEQDYKRKSMLEHQIIKLADMENFTFNILNSIDSGVIALNYEGDILSTNRQIKNILGSKANVKDFLENESLSKEVKKVLLDEESIVKKEYSCITLKSKESHLKIIMKPLKNISGNSQGAVVVVEDITMIKKLETQVKRGERLAAVGQLASGIAHEIRNPLGIIKTISQTMHHGLEEVELKEGLQIIEHEIDRANNVIKGLLDFSRSNKVKIENINLSELLKEIVMITKKFGQHNGVAITLVYNSCARIQGDTDKLKQAFINIILNGIQAMENGGELTILLDIEEHRWARISFSDKGKGIEASTLDKIFNPFFTTKDEGTGLGLSITHRIIEEHQGKIEVKSIVQEGTEVRILLPLLDKESI
ncbi:MAG: sensor histidine kinase [Clostridiaceae bacterium]|nr:sensor histidine kinase [Clostridiaceae bacterium]